MELRIFLLIGFVAGAYDERCSQKVTDCLLNLGPTDDACEVEAAFFECYDECAKNTDYGKKLKKTLKNYFGDTCQTGKKESEGAYDEEQCLQAIVDCSKILSTTSVDDDCEVKADAYIECFDELKCAENLEDGKVLERTIKKYLVDTCQAGKKANEGAYFDEQCLQEMYHCLSNLLLIGVDDDCEMEVAFFKCISGLKCDNKLDFGKKLKQELKAYFGDTCQTGKKVNEGAYADGKCTEEMVGCLENFRPTSPDDVCEAEGTFAECLTDLTCVDKLGYGENLKNDVKAFLGRTCEEGSKENKEFLAMLKCAITKDTETCLSGFKANNLKEFCDATDTLEKCVSDKMSGNCNKKLMTKELHQLRDIGSQIAYDGKTCGAYGITASYTILIASLLVAIKSIWL